MPSSPKKSKKQNDHIDDYAQPLSAYDRDRVADFVGGEGWNGALFHPLGDNWFFVQRPDLLPEQRREIFVRVGAHIEESDEILPWLVKPMAKLKKQRKLHA